MVEGIQATYKDFTRNTARYPKRKELDYLVIGLMNEAGEVGGVYKKMIRSRTDLTTPNKDGVTVEARLVDELGDVLWYLTRLCDVYDIKISELMVNNMDKLFNRMSDEGAKAYRDEH